MLPLRIAGTGVYLPGPPVDNGTVASWSGGAFTAEWVVEWTGIRTRHFAAPHETVASMAAEASREALARADLPAASLDRIILTCSTGGDRPGPATANVVQSLLGATCACFDVTNGCHGFLTGLDLAARHLATGGGPVLVVASELLSRHRLERSNRRTFPLFGDGAAAAVIGPARGEGALLASVHGNRGELWDQLYAPGLDDPDLGEGPHIRFAVDGRRMRSVVEETLPALIHQALSTAGRSAQDVEWLVPHQPNHAWLVRLCGLLDVPLERVPVVVDRTANVPTAMVPLGLHQLLTSGRAHPGHHVLSFGLGGGMSYGASVLRLD